MPADAASSPPDAAAKSGKRKVTVSAETRKARLCLKLMGRPFGTSFSRVACAKLGKECVARVTKTYPHTKSKMANLSLSGDALAAIQAKTEAELYRKMRHLDNIVEAGNTSNKTRVVTAQQVRAHLAG